MITTPPTRLIESAGPEVSPSPETVDPTLAAAGVVTAEQVERAVLQLRERPGKTPVEQIQAVLREFGLTVAPPRS